MFYDKIKIKMENKGTKNDKGYKLEIDNENEHINIELMDRNLLIEVLYDNIRESWSCYLTNDTSISYAKFENYIETIHKQVSINKDTKLKADEEEIYKKLTEYINKYLLNSE